MIVVADSSPLIALINIGHTAVLPRLFGQVIIPPEISAELNVPTRPQAVRDFIVARPNWLLERAPARLEPIPTLHPGEVAAIRLAQELKADLLLIDELRGRKAAVDLDIAFTGTPTSGFRPNCLMSDSSTHRGTAGTIETWQQYGNIKHRKP